MKCKYSDDGCEFEQMPSKKEALDNHEKECEHRTIACTLVFCNKTLSLSKLKLHLKDDHKVTIYETKGCEQLRANLIGHGRTFRHQIKWVTWRGPRLFTLNDGKQFYRQFARSPNGFFFLWVYMIGTPKEAEDFTYTFTLFSANKVIFSWCLRSNDH